MINLHELKREKTKEDWKISAGSLNNQFRALAFTFNQVNINATTAVNNFRQIRYPVITPLRITDGT